jgi:uncharacterized RDD family membrane protein YckC
VTLTKPPPAARLGLQGHYAGAVSRFAAYAIDVLLSGALFLAGLAATVFAVKIITLHSLGWNRHSPGVDAAYAVWLVAYFGYSWAAFGKTIGMALLGVRVVAADGSEAGTRRALVRTAAFPLSILLLGLGLLPILARRDRRALHDLIAGTAVIYDWDARSARIRYLARK